MFKSQPMFKFFAAVCHFRHLRKQKFTSTNSKVHGLWFVIGVFQQKNAIVSWLLNFRVCMLLKSAVIIYLTGTVSRTLLDSDCTGSVAITYKKFQTTHYHHCWMAHTRKTWLCCTALCDCFGRHSKKILATQIAVKVAKSATCP